MTVCFTVIPTPMGQGLGSKQRQQMMVTAVAWLGRFCSSETIESTLSLLISDSISVIHLSDDDEPPGCLQSVGAWKRRSPHTSVSDL